MKIALSKINPGLNRFELDWPAGALGPEDDGDVPRTIGRIEGWITLKPLREPVEEADILVEGRVTTKVKGECDRCLEEFVRPVDLEFKATLVRNMEEDLQEKELRGEELNYSLIEGQEIDLKKIVIDQMILDSGMVDLCSPECLGLCPSCGCNLNTDRCECKKNQIDPRLAALADWKAEKN